jgi:hypothetical protein
MGFRLRTYAPFLHWFITGDTRPPGPGPPKSFPRNPAGNQIFDTGLNVRPLKRAPGWTLATPASGIGCQRTCRRLEGDALAEQPHHRVFLWSRDLHSVAEELCKIRPRTPKNSNDDGRTPTASVRTALQRSHAGACNSLCRLMAGVGAEVVVCLVQPQYYEQDPQARKNL